MEIKYCKVQKHSSFIISSLFCSISPFLSFPFQAPHLLVGTNLSLFHKDYFVFHDNYFVFHEGNSMFSEFCFVFHEDSFVLHVNHSIVMLY